jgi:hypothetical protein
VVIFSAKNLEIMSESAAASPANLDDERDELKFELIVLKGHLKDKFDFSSVIDPLLDATAPATIEINAKMKRLVARLQAKLETSNMPDRNKPQIYQIEIDRNKPTTPSPAPPPTARAGRVALAPAVPPPRAYYRAPSQNRQCAKRARIADPPIRAENGEILPRVGDFPVFAVMLHKTIHETGAAARWAFTLLRARMEEAMKAPNLARWLINNWEQGPHGEQPPCEAGKFRSHITGCYLVPSNLLRAATEDNKDLIEIARGRRAAALTGPPPPLPAAAAAAAAGAASRASSASLRRSEESARAG